MKRFSFVTVLVAACLALTFGVGIQSASADDGVLIPYYTSGGGDLTFIQLLNTAATTTGSDLQFTYVYTTFDGSEVCTHFDGPGDTTQNDIMVFEVANGAAQFGASGQILPGDTTSRALTLPITNVYGYLGICQSTGNSLNEGSLFGQTYIVNYMTGDSFAAPAINDPSETDAFPFWTNADDAFFVTWMPDSLAGGIMDNLWYLFPVNGWDICYDDIVDGSAVRMNDVVTVAEGLGRIYDNNEFGYSGQRDLSVGCVPTTSGFVDNFFFTLADFLSGAQLVSAGPTGGFTDIYFNNAYGYVYKILSTDVLGSQMSTMIYETGLTQDLYSYTK